VLLGAPSQSHLLLFLSLCEKLGEGAKHSGWAKAKGRRKSPAFRVFERHEDRAHFSDDVFVGFVSDFFSFSVATRFARVSRTFPLTPLNVSGGPPLPMRAE